MKKLVRLVVFIIIIIPIKTFSQAGATEKYGSLTDVIRFHLNEIVDSEIETSDDKILLWKDNLPGDLKINSSVYAIGQDLLMGDNGHEIILNSIRSNNLNELFGFNIYLNGNILMIQAFNDFISIEGSNTTDSIGAFIIDRRNYSNYYYKLDEKEWAEISEEDLDNVHTDEYFMENNELQFFFTRCIMRSIEHFKSKNFNGIYLAKPDFVIASSPWVVTNYSFNPNYLRNIKTQVPCNRGGIMKFRQHHPFAIQNKLNNILIDTFQTSKLYILAPKYTLKGDTLNISIVLNELRKDESGGSSFIYLDSYDTKIKYDPIELDWKETHR